jgi:hypothetical protein
MTTKKNKEELQKTKRQIRKRHRQRQEEIS